MLGREHLFFLKTLLLNSSVFENCFAIIFFKKLVKARDRSLLLCIVDDAISFELSQ